MGKMKTHKATSKRVTVTGSGKLRRRKVGLTHLQTKRSSRTQMRNNNGAMTIAKSDEQNMKQLLGL
ncbi:MAG TPA: 50S ribosomal protein L35 [Abditibacteriaceae bacterium]